MEKAKISAHQIFALTTNMTVGGALLIISSPIAAVAKQDAWISAAVGALFSCAQMCAVFFLFDRHKGMSFLEITKKIAGRRLGAALYVGCLSTFFVIAHHVPWYIGNFVGQVMEDTPKYALSLLYAVAAVMAVMYGFEAVSRASEIFLAFVMFLFAASVALVAPKIKVEHILPALEEGPAPVFKGAIYIVSFLTYHLLGAAMICREHAPDAPDWKKAVAGGHWLANLVVFVTIVMSILVLGAPVVARSAFPTLLLAREIDVGTFLARLEYVVSVTWIITQFTTGLVYFYLSVRGISELLGLRDHRRIVLPMGLLVLALSGTAFHDTSHQVSWINTVWLPYSIAFTVVLPLALYVVYIARLLLSGKK